MPGAERTGRILALLSTVGAAIVLALVALAVVPDRPDRGAGLHPDRHAEGAPISLLATAVDPRLTDIIDVRVVEPRFQLTRSEELALQITVLAASTARGESVHAEWEAQLAAGALEARSDLIREATILVRTREGGTAVAGMTSVPDWLRAPVTGPEVGRWWSVRARQLAARAGLAVERLAILKPLGAALDLVVVTKHGDFSQDEFSAFFRALLRTPQRVDGLYVELRDTSGRVLRRSGFACRLRDGRGWSDPTFDPRAGNLPRPWLPAPDGPVRAP